MRKVVTVRPKFFIIFMRIHAAELSCAAYMLIARLVREYFLESVGIACIMHKSVYHLSCYFDNTRATVHF